MARFGDGESSVARFGDGESSVARFGDGESSVARFGDGECFGEDLPSAQIAFSKNLIFSLNTETHMHSTYRYTDIHKETPINN